MSSGRVSTWQGRPRAWSRIRARAIAVETAFRDGAKICMKIRLTRFENCPIFHGQSGRAKFSRSGGGFRKTFHFFFFFAGDLPQEVALAGKARNAKKTMVHVHWRRRRSMVLSSKIIKGWKRVVVRGANTRYGTHAANHSERNCEMWISRPTLEARGGADRARDWSAVEGEWWRGCFGIFRDSGAGSNFWNSKMHFS